MMKEVKLEDVDIDMEFADGLHRIGVTVENAEDIGTFLLLQANVFVDAKLGAKLSTNLADMGKKLKTDTIGRLRDGIPPDINADDLLVFLAIDAIGIAKLRPFARKRVGPWDLQFNHIRCLRPKRVAGGLDSGVIYKMFSDKDFHFNKPFLKDECFSQCTHQDIPVHLFYNKFPFHKGHILVVPAPEENYGQYLTRPHLLHAWSIAKTLGERHGMRLGYNSLGAYASVNHLHYQAVLGSLPVEDDHWRHNGGCENYPTACEVFTDAEATWAWIDSKHEKSIAYNLLLSGARAFCFCRQHQADVEHEKWTSGFAWYELSGSFIAFNTDDFELIDDNMIRQEMKMIQLK